MAGRVFVVAAFLIASGWRPSLARADGGPGKGDPAAANARELYTHLQITFVGKDAFRENLILRGATFYEAVERPDLAARYRQLEARRNLVGLLGGAALGAGAVWGGIDLTIAKTDPRAHHTATPIPWAIAIAGLVAVIVGSALPSEPATEPERQALARDHNQRTAARLGADPTLR